MDWSNESYVRLYTRDTTTWRRLGWHGQNLLMQLIRKVDRSGTLDIGSIELWEAAVLHVGAPESDARSGAERLLALEVVAVRGGRVVFPNFIEAQECVRSDALRSREYRRRRATDDPQENHDSSRGVTVESQGVTPPSREITGRHDASREVTAVTNRHSLLCSASSALPEGESAAALTAAGSLPLVTVAADLVPDNTPDVPDRRKAPRVERATLKAATASLCGEYGHEVPPTASDKHWAQGSAKVSALVKAGAEPAAAASRVAKCALEWLHAGKSTSYGYALQDCTLGPVESHVPPPRFKSGPVARAEFFQDLDDPRLSEHGRANLLELRSGKPRKFV